MPRKTSGGIASGRLLKMAAAARSAGVGRRTAPGFQPTTTVKPSFNPSDALVCTWTSLPSTVAVARAVDPKAPRNAVARTPDTPSGSRTTAEADSIGTSHSSPVTFQ